MNPSPFHEENLKKAERVAYLIAGHLRGTLTPAEQEELDDWITASDENLELFETLTDEDNIEAAMQQYLQLETGKDQALSGIKQRLGLTGKESTRKKTGPYLMAAAVILIAASLYLFTYHQPPHQREKPIAQSPATGDVPAGSAKAVLTLSDGRTLILDAARTGFLAQEGAVRITTSAPEGLRYNGTDADMKYNRIATPRGGQYEVVLGDGTHVWLNAESALKFPAGFSAADREVELQGEAYFEVAKNPAKPFLVKIGGPAGEGGRVRVLGTHFNINSYGDEGAVQATLLEGVIDVQKGGVTKRLVPGQQALLTGGITIAQADTAAAVAWKDGRFLFRNATIRSIGEQIKRWYDVEVDYQGTITEHFNTEVSRQLPLSRLLEALEGTGQVHFRLTGTKLIITP